MYDLRGSTVHCPNRSLFYCHLDSTKYTAVAPVRILCIAFPQHSRVGAKHYQDGHKSQFPPYKRCHVDNKIRPTRLNPREARVSFVLARMRLSVKSVMTSCSSHRETRGLEPPPSAIQPRRTTERMGGKDSAHVGCVTFVRLGSRRFIVKASPQE